MMKRLAVFSAVTIMAMVLAVPRADARRYVGFWIGSGMAWPVGDFKSDDGRLGDAKMGGRINLGIDFYLTEKLAIGAYGNIDAMGTGDRALIQPDEEIYGFDIEPVKISHYSVLEGGAMAKYFFGHNPKLEPYGKIWLGYSGTEIISDKSAGAGGTASAAYGFGGGIMWRMLNQIRLTVDLAYNASKMDKADKEKNSSRINLGLAINFLFGN
jgi:hypothetical protein